MLDPPGPWQRSKEQSQVLAIVCFAFRNTFPPLNALSWGWNFNVRASDRETEPPNRRKMRFPGLGGFRSHQSHSAWVKRPCVGGRVVLGLWQRV